MKKVRGSFELLIADNESNHYTVDWLTRTIEENLAEGESLTELHVENADKVAAWLASHPQVAWVSYARLPQNKTPLVDKYCPKGLGALFTFGVKGGHAAARALIDRVKLFSLLANVGDAKSLIIHPASTTHEQLTPEQQRATGTLPELIRLSLGLEDVRDLVEDLDQALGEREVRSRNREPAAAAAR